MKKLAINGGEPLTTKIFPGWPCYDQREIDALGGVIQSGEIGQVMMSTYTKTINQFEDKFAAYLGAKYAICTTNGSVTIEMSLRAAGIGTGDEVIVTPTTFAAPAIAALQVGAKPVFVDIDPDSECMDPDKAQEAVTDKTRAIIPVHLGGHPCDMDRIMAIAKKHNLIVIEDCAQAHGGKWKDKRLGSIGDMGSFSFQRSKMMTSIEGGAITTSSEDLREKCYALTHYGHGPGEDGKCKFNMLGFNHRITEFQAAVLLVQLEKIEAHAQTRLENARYLTSRLSKIEGIKTPPDCLGRAYYSYCIKYDPEVFGGIAVTTLIDALKAEGIYDCFRVNIPNYADPIFVTDMDYSKVHCPVAEKAHRVGMVLSWNMLMGPREDMDVIADAVAKVKDNVGELVGKERS